MFLMCNLLYAGVLIRYEQTGESKFSSLEFDGIGVGPPLTLKKNERMEIKGYFTAQSSTRSLSLDCYFIVGGIQVPISGGEISGITLPVKYGENRFCVMTFCIPNSFANCSGKLLLEVKDENGKVFLGVLIPDCKIVN